MESCVQWTERGGVNSWSYDIVCAWSTQILAESASLIMGDLPSSWWRPWESKQQQTRLCSHFQTNYNKKKELYAIECVFFRSDNRLSSWRSWIWIMFLYKTHYTGQQDRWYFDTFVVFHSSLCGIINRSLVIYMTFLLEKAVQTLIDHLVHLSTLTATKSVL